MKEWMTIGIDKPEVGKSYIVLTLDGQYQLKRYVKGYTTEFNQLTEDLSRRPPDNKDGEIEEGFIPVAGGWYGRKSSNVALFCELPAVPEALKEKAQKRAKIAALKAEVRRLEKQLKEEEA